MDHLIGDVVKATRRGHHEGYHYIIVWNGFDEGDDFIGIMLTKNSTYVDNILMSKEHFVEGNVLTWNESQHFVNRLLMKFAAWGPFTKVGELTAVGVQFITENLQEIEPVPFEVYLAERKSA
ncbi:MAG: hypothetical protein KDD40_07495 [Bdellovibrionales bacterium]|nr:hypothetical protein [Bdellovibrionales bacterium]